jgi:hypothetical protein
VFDKSFLLFLALGLLNGNASISMAETKDCPRSDIQIFYDSFNEAQSFRKTNQS